MCNFEHYFLWKSRVSSVSVVTKLWAGQPEFSSWQEHEFFIFATKSQLALDLTQPSVQRVLGSHYLGVKQSGHMQPFTHLHLMLGLRMPRVIHLLLHMFSLCVA
jgi:hypothetical protein